MIARVWPIALKGLLLLGNVLKISKLIDQYKLVYKTKNILTVYEICLKLDMPFLLFHFRHATMPKTASKPPIKIPTKMNPPLAPLELKRTILSI